VAQRAAAHARATPATPGHRALSLSSAMPQVATVGVALTRAPPACAARRREQTQGGRAARRGAVAQALRKLNCNERAASASSPHAATPTMAKRCEPGASTSREKARRLATASRLRSPVVTRPRLPRRSFAGAVSR